MNQKFWEGKVIVITGSSSGIGAAIREKLQTVDCKIFAIDLKDTQINSTSTAKVTQIQCDISKEMEIDAVYKVIADSVDKVDVFFNNAGITAHGRFDEMDMSVFKKTFDINFFGGVYLTRKLIEMIKKARGAIISTSTVSGLYGIPGRSVYSSSKSALHAVFESIRIELSEFGVRSIIFCPPYTKTNLRTSGLDSSGKTLNEAQHGGRLKTPEEVAERMIKAVEDPNARLVTMDRSGIFVKWMRLFAPALLEKILFKKLYKDFH
ncbi:MAG: SDR family NAD(P)-dependent oxidoreductase [Leptospiraceae bacterium]|nr:SDR family NAD(P)-dependent oxidoreductase [Leptospiraceae bacterium]MCP5502461.1 SDR family NAD(P)-dependent oxidoreductase [Leptospiraceae bacterium]